jgi:hypothetical protein
MTTTTNSSSSSSSSKGEEMHQQQQQEQDESNRNHPKSNTAESVLMKRHLGPANAATEVTRVVTARVPTTTATNGGGGGGGSSSETAAAAAAAGGRWVVRSASDPHGSPGQKVMTMTVTTYACACR